MQERQTQVLALPARAEGSDRDTEGILRSAFSRLTVGIHGIPRNSQRFHVDLGCVDPCCEMHRGLRRGMLSFSLWRLLVSLPPLFHSSFLQLSLYLSSAFLSWSGVTLFQGAFVGKGGGGILVFTFFPPFSSNDPGWFLLSPLFLCLFHTCIHTQSMHWQSSTLPPPWLPCIAYLTSRFPSTSLLQSVLTHVCANVTSIFHRQPLPVSKSALLLQNICRTNRPLWRGREPDKSLCLLATEENEYLRTALNDGWCLTFGRFCFYLLC